jgi:hypothetical protein
MICNIDCFVECILKEFAVAGMTPELNRAPESEAPGKPLVTVGGCS